MIESSSAWEKFFTLSILRRDIISQRFNSHPFLEIFLIEPFNFRAIFFLKRNYFFLESIEGSTGGRVMATLPLENKSSAW